MLFAQKLIICIIVIYGFMKLFTNEGNRIDIAPIFRFYVLLLALDTKISKRVSLNYCYTCLKGMILRDLKAAVKPLNK